MITTLRLRQRISHCSIASAGAGAGASAGAGAAVCVSARAHVSVSARAPALIGTYVSFRDVSVAYTKGHNGHAQITQLSLPSQKLRHTDSCIVAAESGASESVTPERRLVQSDGGSFAPTAARWKGRPRFVRGTKKWVTPLGATHSREREVQSDLEIHAAAGRHSWSLRLWLVCNNDLSGEEERGNRCCVLQC